MDVNAFERFSTAVRQADLKVESERRDGFMMECPVHTDGNPSVNVDYRGGKVLVKCHAGCNTQDIVSALALEIADLFDEEPERKNNDQVIAEYPYRDGFTGETVFVKRRWFPKRFDIGHYENGTWRFGMNSAKPWLYRAPELREALDDGQTVWIVEGEKDVHAMVNVGAFATTQPHGAGPGKWTAWHSSLLRRAKDVRIVMDIDQDKEDGSNTGRDYAFEIRNSLMTVGVKPTLWRAKTGKDASDHLAAGHTLDEFVKIDPGQIRTRGSHYDELMLKEFPPIVWAVKDILPQGVCLLAAPPKAGKSWMTVDIAVAVGTGGKALGRLEVTQGDVLYIGLEDSERRLQERILLLCEGVLPETQGRIEFQTIDSGWGGGETGLAWMEEWAASVEEPRLIVIDTLRKHEPQLDEARNAYIAEQEMMLRYKRFADRHNLTVLFVHHDAKADDNGDWLNRFSGSKGLTGGADTLWLLDHKRGEREGFLRIDGRDVVADDLPIHKAKGRPFWLADECPDDISAIDISLQQRKIMSFIREGNGTRALNVVRVAFPGKDNEESIASLLRLGMISYNPDNGWVSA